MSSKNKSESKAWIAIFPILAILILVSLAMWKRKAIKNRFDNKETKFKKLVKIEIFFKIIVILFCFRLSPIDSK